MERAARPGKGGWESQGKSQCHGISLQSFDFNNFQSKGSALLNETKVLPVARDDCSTDSAATKGNQDIIEESTGKFAPKLRGLL